MAKIQGSAWKITINSNQEKHHGTSELFEAMIRRLCLSKMFMNFILVSQYPSGDPKFTGFEFLSPEELGPLIDEVQIHGADEIGGIMKRIHSHITIQIFHYYYFKIDWVKLRNWFSIETGQKIRPKIDGKIISHDPSFRRYQEKTFGRDDFFRVVSEVRGLNGKRAFFDSARDL